MKDKKEAIEESKDKEVPEKTCGIIMPISNHPDYPPGHWLDVLNIIKQAIEETEFEPKLVSEDEVVGLIHERIVTNIYNNEIVVCDVSSKNPNVMFELGLRLAFDKPTIIIKDEKTDYSFDTGGIEHILYPSSLRFAQILNLKIELKNRIIATFEKSKSDPNFSPFLKSFGKTIKPTTIHPTEISENKYIIEQMAQIRKDLQSLKVKQNSNYDFNAINFSSLNQDGKLQFLAYLIDKKLINIDIQELFNDNNQFYKNTLISQFYRYGVGISMQELDNLLKIHFNYQFNNLNKLK